MCKPKAKPQLDPRTLCDINTQVGSSQVSQNHGSPQAASHAFLLELSHLGSRTNVWRSWEQKKHLLVVGGFGGDETRHIHLSDVFFYFVVGGCAREAETSRGIWLTAVPKKCRFLSHSK